MKNPKAQPNIAGRRKGGFRRASKMAAPTMSSSGPATLNPSADQPEYDPLDYPVQDALQTAIAKHPRFKKLHAAVKSQLRGVADGMLNSQMKGVKF